jgi:hypothetical protein
MGIHARGARAVMTDIGAAPRGHARPHVMTAAVQRPLLAKTEAAQQALSPMVVKGP